MKKGRRNFPAKFKAKVAIEAVEGGKMCLPPFFDSKAA